MPHQAIEYNTAQHNHVQYDTIKHNTTQYNESAIQHDKRHNTTSDTIPYNTIVRDGTIQ